MADSQIPPDPNIIPPDQSASSDPNRPVSTTLADSQNQPQPPLADSGSDYTEPQSTVPADSTVQSADQPTTTPAGTETPPSSPATTETPVMEATPSPEPTAPTTSEASSGGSIQDSLPSDQPSQVQPVTPEPIQDQQISQAPKTAPESAKIKPEPLEGTQNAPLADLPSEASVKSGSDSQKSSFGDILVGIGNPSPAPTTPESQSPTQTPAPPLAPSPKPPVPPPTAPEASPQTPPKSSFGDLMGNSPTEPTINIEPIQPPKEEKPVSPPNPSSPSIPSPPSDDKKQLKFGNKSTMNTLSKFFLLSSRKGKSIITTLSVCFMFLKVPQPIICMTY